MIATKPPEWFLLDERLLIVFKCPVQSLFPQYPCILILFPFFNRDGAPEFKFPWRFRCGGVILDMFYISSPLKDQCIQSLIAKFFRGPATTGTGPDNDRLICSLFFIIGHRLRF